MKQDATSRLNNRVLENTWVGMKNDLPSPILKNGINGCESNSTSPLSMDFSVKTSSPILSPTRSSQSINTDGKLICIIYNNLPSIFDNELSLRSVYYLVIYVINNSIKYLK